MTNYKYKKADKYHKHKKIQKNNIIIFITQLRDSSLNRLCLKSLTFANFMNTLLGPWKGPMQVRDHEA